MKFTDLQNYFKYYQENEMQFSETTRFVYVDKKCKAAYSFVYANLLLSICSDFEALTRYCFEKRDDEILEIEQIIALLESNEYFFKALSQEVELDGYGKFIPMNVVDFRKHKVFEWWKAYNKIKHNKLKSIHVACQSNVVMALASLYVLNRYALKKCSIDTKCPDIFTDDVSKIKLLDFKTEYSKIGMIHYDESEQSLHIDQ